MALDPINSWASALGGSLFLDWACTASASWLIGVSSLTIVRGIINSIYGDDIALVLASGALIFGCQAIGGLISHLATFVGSSCSLLGRLVIIVVIVLYLVHASILH